MTYSHGDKVVINNGERAGEDAVFLNYSRRTKDNSWCFVGVSGGRVVAAQVKVEDIRHA